jgi:hypothetical protein
LIATTTSGTARLAGVALVATLCAALLTLTHALTAPRIAANEALAANARVLALLGEAPDAPLAGTWHGDVRALCDGRVLARLRVPGYAGPIRLLAAVRQQPEPALIGVVVISHLETPGIADFLDQPDRGWLAALSGASAAELSRVDAVSGATISSRAVRRGLESLLADAAVTGAQCSP